VKWFKRGLAVFALLLAAAAVFAVPTIFGKPWLIEHFYMRVLVQAVFDDPLVLTQLRMFEAIGLHFHADDLPDMTMALREKQAARATDDYQTLESYDRGTMSPGELLSFDEMHWLLELGVAGANRFMAHSYAFDQLGGLHVRFPDVMVNYHLIETESDARDYLIRVGKIGGALDDMLATTNQLAARGFTIPRFILAKVEKDARAFASKPAEENVLFVDFRDKVAKLDLAPEEKAALVAEMEQTLTTRALPGYVRFADAVAAMVPRASDDAGVWHLPDGDAYYALCIEQNTSTKMTADEIHQLGLREVERIEKEMRAILESQGAWAATSTASLGDRLRALAADPKYLYPDTDEGRKQILARYEEITREMESKLDTLFATDPKAPISIERVAEFKEKTSPVAYYFPETLDDKKPGVFYVNLRDTKEHHTFGMRTLVYHEAVPGHHFQISIARAQKDLPLFRQLIPLTAYSEGWALYAEQLADEHGYEPEPFDRLGYLDGQLLRAVRLVVDTGIHSKRWTREQAIQYMLDHTGSPATEVETEIDRYVVWPGQALGYMVGRIRILELRERAKTKLGDKFDLREFHDAILLQGALPLSLLEREVDRWIAAKAP
jgi:uncharacterized protein (DUF885 family)